MLILNSLLSAFFVSVLNRCVGVFGVRVILVFNSILTLGFAGYNLYLVMYRCIFTEYVYFDWLFAGRGVITWGFWFDTATAVMCLTVLLVSTLVHLYSCFYMGQDPYLRKFLVYLTLFTFFMLFLVSANNFIQLFFGWEGVGICSYLLINFWYTRLQANKSALKAVLVNRVGDGGLIFAISLILLLVGSVNFQTVYARLPYLPTIHFYYSFGLGLTFLDLVCLLLFIGVMAKSAQLGLHMWLPDAMEGPTPVSALIHAATMVTAGIYLMIRSLPFFECSPAIVVFAGIVGGLTAVFAASVALMQHDLKKIIAYSTCSQLGYMVMACAIFQPFLSLFHLVNHAFFKALLFLGAGVIIHCCSGEQDLRKLGGLQQFFPLTFASMFVASASLAGVPFLSGFYSKDMIIGLFISQGLNFGNSLWCLGVLAAICTSIYSFSLVYFIFFSSPRGAISAARVMHLTPFAAGFPMFVLVFFSIFSGFYLKEFLIGPASDNNWTSLSVFSYAAVLPVELIEVLPLKIKLVPFFAAFSGIAYYIYTEVVGISPATGRYFTGWYFSYLFLARRWYWDWFFNMYVNWPVYKSAFSFVYYRIDKGGVEAAGSSAIRSLSFLVGGWSNINHVRSVRGHVSILIFFALIVMDFALFYFWV